MTVGKKPSEEELKREYGDGVEVRRQMPHPEEIKEKQSWLENVAGGIGYEKWMWKTWGGVLIGIIVITPNVSGVYDFWKPVITTGYEYASPYISILSQAGLQVGNEIVAFAAKPKRNKQVVWDDYDHLIAAPAPQPVLSDVLVDTENFFRGSMWRVSSQVDLSGRGALIIGGRFHNPGRPLLYSSADALVPGFAEV